MLLLERTIPSKLEVCKALLRRGVLSNYDETLLNELIWRTSIGFEGEQFADKYWEDLRLTIPYYLLHSFESMHTKGYRHQMDTIFVCQHFVFIVELKYIAGEIHYDEKTNQLWRIYNGQKLVLGDPFAQVSRHEMWMTQFLWEIGLDLPIITAVVVTSKSALLGKMPDRYHVFKLEGLRLKLLDWLKRYPVAISDKQLTYVAQQLHLQHKPILWDWRKNFGHITLRNGVVCACGKEMIYIRGSFRCSCGARDSKAHLIALHDYRLLVSEWITNGQFRQFLNIESPHAANKILKRLKLEEHGATRLRKYKIPHDLYQEEYELSKRFSRKI